MDFAFYLGTQYMRTNKMKQSIIQSLQGIKSVNIENCWSIMRHIFAANMAWILYAERNLFKIFLIVNDTTTPFLTGDQPVIYTYGAGKLGKETFENVELYYPVSHTQAILISKKDEYKKTLGDLNITEDKAIEFNNMIVDFSHDQVYANSCNELQIYAGRSQKL